MSISPFVKNCRLDPRSIRDFISGEDGNLVRTQAEVEGEIEDVLPQGGAYPDASASRSLTEHPARSDDLCQAIAHGDASIGRPPYNGGLFSHGGLRSYVVPLPPDGQRGSLAMIRFSGRFR